MTERNVNILPKSKPKTKVKRPRLYKVLLLNDDYTPREFVIIVLQKVFGVPEARAHSIMWTAHTRGVCVVAVYTREVAETKATQATDEGRRAGFPLMFSTEPEQ